MSNRIVTPAALPSNPITEYDRQLYVKLNDIFRSIAARVNDLSDGRMSATDNKSTVIPTTGLYAIGDFVRNIQPVELGTTGAKYIVTGWTCIKATSSSTAATFVQTRSLTGN
jgi:hypothetical protein